MRERVAWHKRLTTRVLFFLTLAMLPLGIISVLQNQRLSAEIEQKSELSLLALTEHAASGERQLFLRAVVAAQTLAAIGDDVFDDPRRCRATVEQFKRSNTSYAFVGFVGKDGISACSTANRVLDFSDYPGFADLIAEPRPSVEVNLRAPGSGQSVVVVSHPYFDGTTLAGYASVSLSLRDLGQAADFLGQADPAALIAFNTAGQLVLTEAERLSVAQFLPRDLALADLAHGQARTMIAAGLSGDEYVYSLVPIVPGMLYAMGVWPKERLAQIGNLSALADAGLSILMWLASLLVVWFIIHRLVIERVTFLSRAMQGFARDRRLPELSEKAGSSAEFSQLEEVLSTMAEVIVRDEAAQEDQLREKSVLLKEVHHRVKNNLQIISSIMNMQIRKARAHETKTALAQVQDRIMGLSGVHRTLYEATNLTEIDAAALIRQIVEQSRAIGEQTGKDLKVNLALDVVVVFPDQAVPLSMLVSEVLTNAMKYGGGPAPYLSIFLSLSGADRACLIVENSKADPPSPNEAASEETSTGLGHQLIQAFAIQLDGTVEIVETDKAYRLELSFDVDAFKEEPQDY